MYMYLWMVGWVYQRIAYFLKGFYVHKNEFKLLYISAKQIASASLKLNFGMRFSGLCNRNHSIHAKHRGLKQKYICVCVCFFNVVYVYVVWCCLFCLMLPISATLSARTMRRLSLSFLF